MSGTAKSIVHVENDRVIVTEYRFQPGENTGWHRHGHDYVVVPLEDGTLEIVSRPGAGTTVTFGVPRSRLHGRVVGRADPAT